MRKIGILGSCVTRDAFEHKKGAFDISGNYFARNSIISMMSTPVKVDYSDIHEGNQWVKWLIVNDFEKNVLKIIKQKKLDFLVIDLIDERFDLLFINGSYLNISYEFKRSCSSFIESHGAKVINRNSQFVHQTFLESAKRLGSFLKKECPGLKVVLHEAYATNYYVENGERVAFDEDVKGRNKVMNDYLKEYYSALKKFLDVDSVIKVDNEFQLADSDHKWGLAPYHFVDEYYVKFMDLLSEKVS